MGFNKTPEEKIKIGTGALIKLDIIQKISSLQFIKEGEIDEIKSMLDKLPAYLNPVELVESSAT